MLLSARTEATLPRREPAVGPVVAAIAAAAAATAGALADAVPGHPEGVARRLFAEALGGADVAAIAWPDREEPEPRRRGAALVLALTPLEGADDLNGGMPAGTIFSLRPAGTDPADAFRASGRTQVAAGFVTYGPRTLLTLTDGTATTTRILDPRSGAFRPPVSLCIRETSPRGGPDATRRGEAAPTDWTSSLASLSAGAQRVLTHGGLHLRPADIGHDRDAGGVRLVHAAAPVALAIEAAGGTATDGRGRAILDLATDDLHRRTPLAVGSPREVASLLRRLDAARDAGGSPLFAPRGLLRA
ncbi:fructose-bisphosphatase [Methylobacterium tarhaniae]|uniref:fructose-bisphosphatase n=1 Tax=Methylobacterium tarhaniae TaxID=1187852 RepID=UPI003D081EAE